VTVRYGPASRIQSGMYQQCPARWLKTKPVESRLPEPPGRLQRSTAQLLDREFCGMPDGIERPVSASSRRTKLRRTDDKGLPCPPFSRQPFASSSPCAQGRDAESHPTPRDKRHIASLSGRPAFNSDALSCPLRPNDAGRPDRRGTSSGGHRPSNPATRQWCVTSSNARNETESMRGSSTHQDVAL
jgi:hypothetical protein